MVYSLFFVLIFNFRYEKEDKNTTEENKNEKNPNFPGLAANASTSVTGTDADLRKLEMSKVNSILLKYCNNPELISKLRRWEKIDLLRQISNQKLKETAGDQAQNTNILNELGKFARNMRITTKMQKEIYQKEINRLFGNLIETLGKNDNIDEKAEENPQILKKEALHEETIDNLVKKEERNIMKEQRKKKDKKPTGKYTEKEDLETLKKLAKKYSKDFA